jgi:Ca2+-binding RTX toxin-like protein
VVLGSDAADTFVLNSNQVSVNGKIVTFAGVEQLEVNAFGGNDIITVGSTSVATTVNAGDGNDTVNVGSGIRVSTLDTIQGALTVNGGGGTDALNLDDWGSLSGHNYTVTMTTVQRSGAALITYSGMESLVVNAGSFSDTITVQSTLFGTPVVVNAGDGNDTINMGDSTHSPDWWFWAPLTVHGGSGNDVLNANFQASFGSQGYVLAPGTLANTGMAPVTYDGVESLVLTASPYDDTITVRGTESATAVTINAGGGNDTINVGGGLLFPTLGTIQGALTVNGGDGSDVLNLNDWGTFSPQSYTLTANTLTRTGAANITYTSVSLVVNAGGADDTFTVLGVAVDTPVTLNAGAGNDTINVGSAAKSLDWIWSALTVNGEGGTDVLNINDQASISGQGYTLTANSLTRPGAAPIHFGTVESLLFTASNFNDTVTISSIPAGTAVTVNAGGGNDTLVGPNTANTWMINGANSGTLNGTLTFTSFENLSGGTGSDLFSFASGAAVAGFVNGQGGTDTLDYSVYVTGVYVNLLTGTATGVGGIVSGIENVIGGAGNDILVGDMGNNVLIGGAGRNLLIGGLGADVLVGGPGDDLLIGGTTAFDTNPAALQAVLAEWVSPRDYATRVANLRGTGTGPRLNGNFFLKAQGPGATVFDDLAVDVLTGSGGQDWFWANLSGPQIDQITDLSMGELVN